MLSRMRSLLALTVLLAACSSTGNVPIEGSDSAPAFDLRAEVPFGDRVIELGLSTHAGAEDTQTLTGGETVSVSGTNFTGPQTISSEVDHQRVTAALKHYLPSEGEFQVALLLGFAAIDTEVTVASIGTSASDDDIGLSMWGGAEASFPAFGDWDGVARLEVPLLGDSKAQAIEFLIRRRNTLGFFAGWRLMDLDVELAGSSDLEYELNGPVFGLNFGF